MLALIWGVFAWVHTENAIGQVEAIDLRHRNISEQQRDLRLMTFVDTERFFSVGGCNNGISGNLQKCSHMP
jgi:hypothetical protein